MRKEYMQCQITEFPLIPLGETNNRLGVGTDCSRCADCLHFQGFTFASFASRCGTMMVSVTCFGSITVCVTCLGS
jgi:hypothetical protein